MRPGGKKFRSVPHVALVLVACLLIAGCVTDDTIKLVRNLADEVNRSLDSFKGPPQDLYQSCLRLAAWNYPKVPPKIEDVVPGSAASDIDKGPALTFPPFDPVAETSHLASRCAALRGGIKEWANANEIVIDYVTALSDLAGGAKQRTYHFKELATSIKGAWFVHIGQKPEVPPEQIVEAGSLLDQAVQTAYAAERSKQIDIFARKANRGILRILTLLYQAASEYNEFLKTELSLVEDPFAKIVIDQKRNLTPVEAEIWLHTLEQISNSSQALNRYVQILNVIESVQNELVESTAQSTPEGVVRAASGSMEMITRDADSAGWKPER